MMKIEMRTVQLVCKIHPEVKLGLDRLIEKRCLEECGRSSQGRFVNEALLLLLEQEGIPVDGAASNKQTIMKKPPRSAMQSTHSVVAS